MKRYVATNGVEYKMMQVREVQDNLVDLKGNRYTEEKDLDSWVFRKQGDKYFNREETYEKAVIRIELFEDEECQRWCKKLMHCADNRDEYTDEELKNIIERNAQAIKECEERTLKMLQME